MQLQIALLVAFFSPRQSQAHVPGNLYVDMQVADKVAHAGITRQPWLDQVNKQQENYTKHLSSCTSWTIAAQWLITGLQAVGSHPVAQCSMLRITQHC